MTTLQRIYTHINFLKGQGVFNIVKNSKLLSHERFWDLVIFQYNQSYVKVIETPWTKLHMQA